MNEPPRSLRLLARAFILIGLSTRLACFLDQDGRLFKQFPTEDGYLMLTIARNLGLGRGMSTAEGWIPTNGTQPLFNFIEAIGFYLFDGSRRAGVTWALVCELLLSIACAYGLYRLTLRLLAQRPAIASSSAYLAGAAWFASPVIVPHSMNCLETTLYATFIVYSVEAWLTLWAGRAAPQVAWARAAAVGLLLGGCVWARIDAVFLVAAMTGCHFLLGARGGAARSRFAESFTMGAVAVLVASPWLINNRIQFGSFMPISGTAQSLSASFGSNAAYVPSMLVEYASVVLPIPQSLELLPIALAVQLLVFAGYLVGLVVLARAASESERGPLTLLAVHGGALVAYYGLWFGAPHFVGRYLFPLSLYFAMATAVLVVEGWRRWGSRLPALAPAAGLAALALVGLLNVRLYRQGTQHMHFQVVDFVDRHAGEDVWVAAIQTGTLGFFHEKTVNLDGKVNPEALRMALGKHTPDYVVNARFGPEHRPIEWLADWEAIADWIAYEPISSTFELVVRDEAHRLGVLKRRPTALAGTP
ncbi:MAG TPA: hypothetical protein VLC09_11035 [Polyangiaceae bacterium]|nr:hypothetical protein [Polyangiaceae bacterium]